MWRNQFESALCVTLSVVPSFNYAHRSSLEAPISFDKICGISCHANYITLCAEVSNDSSESVVVGTLQPQLHM